LYQKKLTYVKIGRIFNKTHASIIHSIETVKKHLSKNPELETLIGAFSKI
jgi:chromosomal replication initiation ATPase DnaA